MVPQEVHTRTDVILSAYPAKWCRLYRSLNRPNRYRIVLIFCHSSLICKTRVNSCLLNRKISEASPFRSFVFGATIVYPLTLDKSCQSTRSPSSSTGTTILVVIFTSTPFPNIYILTSQYQSVCANLSDIAYQNVFSREQTKYSQKMRRCGISGRNNS